MDGMSYDSNFDQDRINQLARQCLATNEGVGKVFFLSDSEDNRLDVTTWRFEDDEARTRLMKSQFKLYLIELLDTLLVYRFSHNQPNASQGVVTICQDSMGVQWMSRADFEAQKDRND